MHIRQYNETIGIAGNYHAIVSNAYIRDIESNRQFTAITRQSMGLTSLTDGELELMLHRRTLSNDFQVIE